MRAHPLLITSFILLATCAVRADSPEQLYSQGDVAISAGDYKKAIDVLTKAVQAQPNYAKAYWSRAFAYRQLKQYDLSIIDLNKADQLTPHSAIILNNRGDVYRLMGKYDQAIADLTESLRFSKIKQTMDIRGAVYSLKGDQDRAIQDFDRVIEMDPTYPQAYRNRGNSYRAKKNYAKAIQDYQKAISLDPKYAEAYGNLGWVYATCADFTVRDGKKAVECLSKAHDLFKDRFPFAYDGDLAAAYAENKEFSKAIETELKCLADPTLSPAGHKFHEAALKLYQAGKPYRDNRQFFPTP